MTGFTYFCTDRYGNTYNRYSAMHDAPRYRSAQVYRDRGTTHAVNKAHVSYSKGEVGPLPNFLRSHPRFEHEVVAVRAYPGRHLAGEPWSSIDHVWTRAQADRVDGYDRDDLGESRD
jgi:hypothetical protein